MSSHQHTIDNSHKPYDCPTVYYYIKQALSLDNMTEKDTISRVHVHVSPGSAKTLVRRGGITNHHLIAYSLSNICAKNYQNWLMCVKATVCYISVVF